MAVIGIGLLAVCAAIMQYARVMARARTRRRGRMVRMCSVVNGSPADATDGQARRGNQISEMIP